VWASPSHLAQSGVVTDVVLWSREPFEDQVMVAKSLREFMFEKENLDLPHLFAIYYKFSTFIIYKFDL
jgi:hypothetical protein